MKKITLFWIALLFGINCFSQDLEWQWARALVTPDGLQGDKINASATDAQGNIFVAGQFDSSGLYFDPFTLSSSLPNTREAFVAKFASNGNALWAKKISGAGAEIATCITADSTGDVIVAGTFNGPTVTAGTTTLTNAGGSDIFMIKYSNTGTIIWARSFGGSNDDFCNGIAADSMGNILIAGGFKSATLSVGSTILTNAGNNDALIIKCDSDGIPLWTKSWKGASADMAIDVTSDPSGSVVFTGFYQSTTVDDGENSLNNSGSGSMFLIKYDQNGGFMWSKKWSGYIDDQGFDVASDSNGNIYFLCYFADNYITFDSITLNCDYVATAVVKYSAGGAVNWARINPKGFNATSIAVDSQQNAYVSGNTSMNFVFGNNQSLNADPGDIVIGKYDSSGNEDSAVVVGGDQLETVTKICIDPQDNVIVPGTFKSLSLPFGNVAIDNGSTGDFSEIFLAKLGTGSLGIDENHNALNFTLSPNPVTSKINIALDDFHENLTVCIYNLSGQEIKKIHFSGRQLKIDKEQIAAGIYIIKVTDENNNSGIRKMIVL